MTESADLPRLLGRIRRRARALAALEGAVLGGAIGAGLLTATLAAARALTAGGPSGARFGAAALGVACAAILGAGVAAARRIPLARCARLVDTALDRGARSRDRVLSALAFLDGPHTPLARAAIADAVARARAVTPALAAPSRRPRPLAGLVGAVAALALVGAWPAAAPGARSGGAGQASLGPPRAPGLRVAARAVAAERAEARAAAEAAAAEGDVRLAKLAAELHATLDALTSGELGAGEALDRLGELARRAREAGEEAEEARDALRAADKALEPVAAARGLGRALGADEPDATTRALRELAARLDDRASGAGSESERVARALAAAAAAIGATGGEAGADGENAAGEGRRRLAREPQGPAGAASSEGTRGAPGERRLERLRRDLEDTASACRGDPEACAGRLRDRADDLARLQREARTAEARRRLESAARQTRERLRRGDLERGSGGAERRFLRAAGGEPSSEGGPSSGQRAAGRSGEASDGIAAIEADVADDMFAGDGVGEGGAQDGDASGEGEGAAGGDTEAGAAAAQGQGAGHTPGGEPLGAGGTPPTRGREREARVRSGAGPTRSEVIESAARRGFATRDYVRVFGDYQPVVEESLAAAAVPEGRRYLVRRYFQLIRPRPSRAPGASRSP